MKHFVSFLIYLGFGFLVLYLVGDGGSIDWSNSGELALVLLWPFYLIWQFLKFVLWAALAAAIVFGGWMIIEKIRGN